MRSRVQSGPRPETEYLKALGERVRSERARRGVTRKELAKSAYVSERFLAQLETGHGNISIIRLRRIAHALELGVERLAQERNGEVPEIAGTIAGDDTILVISRSTSLARSFHKRLGEASGRSLR